MTPTQSSLTDTGSVAFGHNTATIPKNSSNFVYFTHHSIKFVMAVEGKNETTKVKCNGEHLIDEVLQCTHHDVHLMCRKCCFSLNEPNSEICPEHKTPVFDDRSTARSICSMQVKCPANETFKVKCPWRGQYKEVTGHLDDCAFIPGSARVTMQNVMLKAAGRRYEQQLEEHNQKTALQICQIKRESDNRIKTMETMFGQMFNDLMQKCDQQANSLDNLSLKLLKQQMTSSAATAVEDEIPPCFNGKLLWPVKDYSVKRTLTESSFGQRDLESPPFYTSERGYKMRMRLYPNGDGSGRGSHISIYFQILPGPFDELLEWPFKEKVTLQVLGFDGAEHKGYSFQPDPQSCSFRRPQHRPNIAMGDATIISHKELKDGGYLRKDTLFVQVDIGSKELS